MTVLNRAESWKQLYSNSEKLSKATSIHNAFSQEDIDFVESRLKYILRQFLKKGEWHKGIKTYIDNTLRNDIVSKMALQPPMEELSLQNWCSQIFEDQKFGVVFNSLEQYDNQLTERMSKIVHPLVEEAGIPLGGISFLFFMGNYGFTPFGIHKEARGEEGFLFHMGPNKKLFYTWNIEKYNAIQHNTQVFHNVKELLPDAESYELKSKSVMFIPNYLYHIANTEEFSFSVVMDYINPSEDDLQKKMAQKIAKYESRNTQNHYVLPIAMNQELDWSRLLNSSSWEKKYQQALQHYVVQLKSNHGVLTPSIKMVQNCIVNDHFSVRGKPLFPLIEWTDANENVYVMARGHEILVKKNSDLSNVLKQLNEGCIFTFDELKEKLLNNTWELYDLYAFVSSLLLFDAVEKQEHQ